MIEQIEDILIKIIVCSSLFALFVIYVSYKDEENDN